MNEIRTLETRLEATKKKHQALEEENQRLLMEYGIELWAFTQTKMPTEKQLRFLLFLLETRKGANPDEIWSKDEITRRDVGAAIAELLKLPERRDSNGYKPQFNDQN